MLLNSRLKKAAFAFIILSVSSLTFLVYERNCYNLVSSDELRAVGKKLSILSVQERRDLASFFEEGILVSPYAYTLVGYKPMSILTFIQESDDLPSVLRADYERPKHKAYADCIERGYQTWEKYQSLFIVKKYLLLRCYASKCRGINKVILIKPELCLKIIKGHLDDFCEVLANSHGAEEVFEILTDSNNENFYKVIEHDQLLGILLGFGRNNAYLFEHREYDKLVAFTNEWPIWPKKWVLPGFLCDPSTEESKQLKESYKKARKFIRWTYFGRNSLEVTLALLCQQN